MWFGFCICRIQHELAKRCKCNCLRVICNFKFLFLAVVMWQNKLLVISFVEKVKRKPGL